LKKHIYIGLFKSLNNDYSLTVTCSNFTETFFLLTADAINLGKHHQLYSITDEKNRVKLVSNLKRINELLTDAE